MGGLVPYLVGLLIAVAPACLFLVHNPALPFLSRWITGESVHWLSYLFFVACGGAAIKLNQRRILVTALLFALSYGLLHTSYGQPAILLTCAIPLSILLIFLVPEGRLLGLSGLGWLLALSGPYAIFFWLWKRKPVAFLALVHWKPSSTVPNLAAPLVSILILLAFLPLGFIHRDRFLRSYRAFVFLAIVAFFPALLPSATKLQVSLSGVACSSLLLYGVFRLFWQKVYVDELTGVANRRAFNEKLPVLRAPYSMVIADIDHFKKFNDVYGHEQGDDVLRFVAQHLDVQSGRRAFRYGGEEFALIYEGKTADEVAEKVDQIRAKLANRNFFIRGSRKTREKTSSWDRKRTGGMGFRVQVTISMGVADSSVAKNPEDVLKVADGALYEAKRKGRNRIYIGAS